MPQTTVQVTQEHIANGKPGYGAECPIAQAMTSCSELNADSADVQYDIIRAYSRPGTGAEQFVDYGTDDFTKDFQKAFDASQPVEPCDLVFCTGPVADHYAEAHCFAANAQNGGHCSRHEE